MKTIDRTDALAIDSILRRIGYDPGQPPGFGPKWRADMADFGEKCGLGEVAQVENYDATVVTPPVAVIAQTFLEAIIDVSHNNPYTLVDLAAKGVLGIIHKASEWKPDPLYAQRKAEALAAGLLWGAYHFSTGEDGITQAERFLSVEDGSDPRILQCLDWEDQDGGRPSMGLSQARAFCQHVRDKTGRFPVVYGSNRPRELVSQTVADPVLSQCPLWIAEIGPTVRPLPPTWHGWTLWQYRDDSLINPKSAGWDWNRFAGSADDLRREWPFTRA